jgi:hypothetical protein
MALPPAQNTGQKALKALLDELLLRIGELVPETQLHDLNSLARSSKRLYTVLNSLLYKRDAMPLTPDAGCGCPPLKPCVRKRRRYRKCFALFWAATNTERQTAIRLPSIPSMRARILTFPLMACLAVHHHFSKQFASYADLAVLGNRAASARRVWRDMKIFYGF